MHKDEDLAPVPKQDVHILGINFSQYGTNAVVGAYTVGIFIIYLTIFVIQESIFKKSHFDFGGLLTFLQFLSYATFALVHRKVVPKLAHERRAPLRFYFSIGFYSVAGTAASCYSLTLLNFPTWVLFKSSRVVGVMIAGIFMLNKRYKIQEYIGVMLLAVGLIIFTLGDIRLLPAFNPLGILLVFVSLVMNSLEGNLQEKGLSQYKASENEMVIYAYGVGALQLLPWLLWNGEMVSGLSFLVENPFLIPQLVVLCTLGYYGILLVLGLCKVSSALTTVIVTSCRKALTVVLSFIVFAKPFSIFYVLGFTTFFVGVGLNVYTKNKEQVNNLVRFVTKRFFKLFNKQQQQQQQQQHLFTKQSSLRSSNPLRYNQQGSILQITDKYIDDVTIINHPNNIGSVSSPVNHNYSYNSNVNYNYSNNNVHNHNNSNTNNLNSTTIAKSGKLQRSGSSSSNLLSRSAAFKRKNLSATSSDNITITVKAAA